MSMNRRNKVGPHGTRPDAGLDLKAVRTGIVAALRTLHSDVLREEVPDRIAELLRQLDQPTEKLAPRSGPEVYSEKG
jgi:Anti-sigma factor NepR